MTIALTIPAIRTRIKGAPLGWVTSGLFLACFAPVIYGLIVAWLTIPALAFAADLMIWHRSILYVGPGLATLLGNFQVFLMALAGYLIYRERLGCNFLAGVALAFVGLYLLVGLDWSDVGAQYRLGVALGIATGFCYAIYMLSTRHAQRSGHVTLPPSPIVHTTRVGVAVTVAATRPADAVTLTGRQSDAIQSQVGTRTTWS